MFASFGKHFVSIEQNELNMRYILSVFLMASSILAVAQEESRGFKGEPFVEVSGSAETEIDPNEITLWIRIREFEENKDKTQLEKLDQQFLTALKAAGIDKKRLTLADAGSTLAKLGKRDKDAFREKTYELVLNSSAEVQNLIKNLEPVKVDMVRVVRIHHSSLETFKLDVKVRALQAARAKAEALAKAVGSTIGKPLMIREWDEGPVYPLPHESNVMFKSAMGDQAEQAADPDIGFRKIRLRGNVQAQFQLQ